MLTTLAELEVIVKEAERHARRFKEVEPNFFSAGGLGFTENPVSDMMAMFMGRFPHIPPWLLKALIQCLSGEAAGVDWSTVQVEREVPVAGDEGEGYKRLDLVVTTSSFILGIENKVLAGADHNPFNVYEHLLAQRGESAGGLPVLRCVLAPTDAVSGRPANWALVRYGQLVEAARAQWGAECTGSRFDKWHVFYREFLEHLEGLSTAGMGSGMDAESLGFVRKNFGELLEVKGLLDGFGEDVKERGRLAVQQGLPANTQVDCGYGNWGALTAKRFAPAIWGGKSNMVITYFHDPEHGSEGSALGWALRAYLHASESRDFEAIYKSYEAKVPLNERVGFYRSQDSVAATWWTEQKEKWLVLDAWPSPYTEDGALSALTDFTRWVQATAFTR